MAHAEQHDSDHYYVPHHSQWPFLGSIALFVLMVGVANWMNGHDWGQSVFYVGVAGVLVVLAAWFGDVISESLQGRYSPQVDVSFRMGMLWFIFSEVMFFAAFFGALFYARVYAMPWLSGEGDGALTNQFLYNGYSEGWPANGPGNIGGDFQTIPAWGVPLLNTLILLCSGTTVTWAHHALIHGDREGLKTGLWLTIILGVLFTSIQAFEYWNAPFNFGENTYGSAFFMATGFHGFHVLVGTIFLIVCLKRAYNGDFTPTQHFGFEAAAWYWHFVDVVWLFLFVVVYVWGGWGAAYH